MKRHLTKKNTEAQGKGENVEKPQERELREAVERVYRAYGSDLSALQRDVRKDLLKLSEAKA